MPGRIADAFRVGRPGSSSREPEGRKVKIVSSDPLKVDCSSKGSTCAVFRLAEAKKPSDLHTAALVRCTSAINEVLDAVRTEHAAPGQCPRIIVTPFGPFLAWTICDERAEGQENTEPEPTVTELVDTLGIDISASREKPTGRHWEMGINGLCLCKKGGDTQTAARFLPSRDPSAVHDATLAECTASLNSILDGCANNPPRPGVELSLLTTPYGLFLGWTQRDDSDAPPLPGAITAEDEAATVVAALGLARPGGAVSWMPIVVVGAVLAIGVVLALAAGGVFSDGSPRPTGTPRPTAPVETATAPPPETIVPTRQPAVGGRTPTPRAPRTPAPTATAVLSPTPCVPSGPGAVTPCTPEPTVTPTPGDAIS